MSRGEEAIDRGLKAAFRQLAAERNECPGPDDLLGFVQGTLEAERAERVGSHVAACAECSVLIVKAEEVKKREGLRWVGWAYAAALVLALIPGVLYFLRPARVVTVQGPVRVERDPAVLEARVFEFPERRRNRDTPVVVEGNQPVFLLSLFAPLREGRTYTAVFTRDGNEVARQDGISGSPRTGLVQLACRRSDFPPGKYTVQLDDETYHFEVR